MGVANSMATLSAGIRTLDSSIGGLRGCPYSPGETALVLVPFPFKLPHIFLIAVLLGSQSGNGRWMRHVCSSLAPFLGGTYTALFWLSALVFARLSDLPFSGMPWPH